MSNILEYRKFKFFGVRVWTEKSKKGNTKVFREASYETPKGKVIKYRVDSNFETIRDYSPAELALGFVKNEIILNGKSKFSI